MSEERRHQLSLIAKLLPGKHNMTSVLEWAVDVAMDKTQELANVPKTWSPHESDRFVRTAHFYPDSLDDSEQRLWHFINYRNEFWLTDSRKDLNFFHFMLLRHTWDMVRSHIFDGAAFDEEKFRDAYEEAPGRAMTESMIALHEAAKAAGINSKLTISKGYGSDKYAPEKEKGAK
jgi:hypothetical protein